MSGTVVRETLYSHLPGGCSLDLSGIVLVRSPRGERVPPLVTGTFGSADFLHSLLGEATDHLSEASLTDLTKRLGSAATQSQGNSPIQTLTNLFSKIPSMGGSNEKLQQGEEMKQAAINLDVNKVAPKEVQKQLWDILVWRDGVIKGMPNRFMIDPSAFLINILLFARYFKDHRKHSWPGAVDGSAHGSP
jgi:hypothetical protein